MLQGTGLGLYCLSRSAYHCETQQCQKNKHLMFGMCDILEILASLVWFLLGWIAVTCL